MIILKWMKEINNIKKTNMYITENLKVLNQTEEIMIMMRKKMTFIMVISEVTVRKIPQHIKIEETMEGHRFHVHKITNKEEVIISNKEEEDM